jgi:hypothetical protein
MDYTKFLRKNSNINKFKLNIENPLIKNAMESLSEIEKSKYFLQNYTKFDYKVDIDEYFSFFLKDKNDLIQELNVFINNKDNLIVGDEKTVYNSILVLLKRNMEDLVTQFKIVKQKKYKKLRKLESFNQMKIDFFKKLPDQGDLNVKKEPKKKKEKISNEILDLSSLGKEEERIRYSESNTVVNIFKNNEQKNYEKAKQILYELSDLTTIFQKKLHEQGEMTKAILFNSIASLENINQGNVHLKKAQEYQKGKGFILGLIFIGLGVFLILYDKI